MRLGLRRARLRSCSAGPPTRSTWRWGASGPPTTSVSVGLCPRRGGRLAGPQKGLGRAPRGRRSPRRPGRLDACPGCRPPGEGTLMPTALTPLAPRGDRTAAESASGGHGGGTGAPQVREAGSAPLRARAGALLRDPQEEHPALQQLHLAHRLSALQPSGNKRGASRKAALSPPPCPVPPRGPSQGAHPLPPSPRVQAASQTQPRPGDVRPLGCGWFGAMSSLFLELEAEAAKLRPLPQMCASPELPKMPGLGMLWWLQPGSASGRSGGR